MLIVCNSIFEKELKPLKDYFSNADIIKAYEKAKWWIWNPIKWSSFKWTVLRKVYLTSKWWAWRIIFLFIATKNIFTPVVLRLKKDKLIWDNLSIKNKYFENILEENLDLIFSDIKSKRYKKCRWI